jgi:hypothetical protein
LHRLQLFGGADSHAVGLHKGLTSALLFFSLSLLIRRTKGGRDVSVHQLGDGHAGARAAWHAVPGRRIRALHALGPLQRTAAVRAGARGSGPSRSARSGHQLPAAVEQQHLRQLRRNCADEGQLGEQCGFECILAGAGAAGAAPIEFKLRSKRRTNANEKENIFFSTNHQDPPRRCPRQ